jgi:hypothetical protein
MPHFNFGHIQKQSAFGCNVGVLYVILLFNSIILSVFLYGHEAWSLALREEHRLKAFKTRVLRIIVGPKNEEMLGGWGEFRNEELHNVYPCSSPNIIRMMNSGRMDRAFLTHGGVECV